jgi:hypothetical protein
MVSAVATLAHNSMNDSKYRPICARHEEVLVLFIWELRKLLFGVGLMVAVRFSMSLVSHAVLVAVMHFRVVTLRRRKAREWSAIPRTVVGVFIGFDWQQPNCV